MRRLLALTLAAGALLPAASARAADGRSIDVWIRGASGRERQTKLDLDAALTEGELTDAQYDGKRRKYRYVTVEDLLKKIAPPANVDVALLHFANGMVIPLAFRDAALMQRLRPAVARQIELDGKWTNVLPEVRRGESESNIVDPRPIRFAGNKLVVAERAHPDLYPNTDAQFSPWLHASALHAIELAQQKAWLQQFDVAPEVRAGYEVWSHTCRFCHGVRKEGARFGWDFVDPLPISDVRKSDGSLHFHVRYRTPDSAARGLQMPALPFVTQKNAADVLAWVRALADHPLNPYTPAR